jgi:hypothetical protein
MRYEANRVAATQKLIGAYERELHPWFERALAQRPTRFVDIGAADGYYAIGIARRGIPVVAFEMSRIARRQLRELAKLNGVTIDLHGMATARRVRSGPLHRALVLSDCEGAEVDIFDAQTVAALRTATVVIEVHESLIPGAEALLRRRFCATHSCEKTAPAPRDQREFSALAAAGPLDWQSAIEEVRSGETPWLLFTPRDASSPVVPDAPGTLRSARTELLQRLRHAPSGRLRFARRAVPEGALAMHAGERHPSGRGLQ